MITRVVSGSLGYVALARELRLLATKLEIAAGGAQEGQAADEPADIREQRLEAARRLFDFWQQITRRKRAKYTPKRRATLLARLKSFKEEELRAVLKAVAQSDFHAGANDRDKRYDTIESVFRNDERVEEWLERLTDADVERASGDKSGRVALKIAELEEQAIQALDSGANMEFEAINREIAELKKKGGEG